MTRLVFLARKLWRYYFYVIAVLVFLILFPAFYLFVMILEKFRTAFWLKGIFCKTVFFFTGIRYKSEIETPLDKNKTYIFCPNHTSYLDIMLSYVTFPNYFLMMGKAELKKVPLFKIFFLKMNIAVERKSKMDSHRAFISASEEIDKGASIVIFPEGTIHNNAPRIGIFKNGAFKLAIDKQIEVVPVTFLNNWTILPDGRKKKNGGKPSVARVIIHKPVSTLGMNDDDVMKLKGKTFEIIDSAMRNYNKE